MTTLEHSAKSHDDLTQKTLLGCREQNASLLAKPPYITTMTICFFLSKPPQSIDMVADFVSKPPSNLGQSLIDDVFGGKAIFFARPRSKCFPNCIVFTLIETKSRKVAIKCFTNGALHITGVENVGRALEIAEMFGALLELVEGGNGCGSMFEVERFELQLMNVHFQMNIHEGKIDLERLFQFVLQRTQHMSSYNKERHNGLIVKILTENMHTVSVIVFDSGNILVCACKDDTSFTEAYSFIIGILQDVWLEVWQKDVLSKQVCNKRKRKHKDNFDYGQYIILS